MLQIYCGNGKGKTTASVGAAVRACGAGLSVLFVQFLKDGSSSEIKVLKSLDGVKVMIPEEFYGFTSQLGDEERVALKACYDKVLEEVERWTEEHTDTVKNGLKGMIVLDEALHAVNAGLIGEEHFCKLIDSCVADYEIILTGYYPTAGLVQKADYISNITNEKHPYSAGVPARQGIER